MLAGNQRHSAVSSLLRLMVVQALLLALPADFQRYPNYDVPYVTSGIDRLYNPLYSAVPPPPPPPVSYSSPNFYGSSIYGVQAPQRPVYPQPNYSSVTPSNCLSYYCYRSALPSLDAITNATAPVVAPVCGKRNYLICVADKPMSTEYGPSSSPLYQYQQSYQQQSNVCPAYFCKLVPRTTPVLVAADSCDSFECNIIE